MAITPGEWIPSKFGFQVLSRYEGKLICHIPDRNDLDIQRGDARLIAAAPALLAACEALIRCYRTDYSAWIGGPIEDALLNVSEAVHRAKGRRVR